MPLLLSVMAGSAYAQAGANCSGANAPRVDVVARLVQPNLDNVTPGDQLSMAASISRPGTTDGITDFQASIAFQFTPSPKGAPCPFQTIQAQVTATKLEVYIAREITPKDCRYKVVYDHEMQHVVLAQKAMDKSVPLLRQSIRALMASLTPQQLSNAEVIAEKLESLKTRSVEALYADYDAGNARLDTPEEGARMAKLCESPKFYVGGKELN